MDEANFVQLSGTGGWAKAAGRDWPALAQRTNPYFYGRAARAAAWHAGRGAGFALLPLANGIIVRMNLAMAPSSTAPIARAVGAEEGSPGHVVLLTPTEFILTDGSRGVARLVTDRRQNVGEARQAARLPDR